MRAHIATSFVLLLAVIIVQYLDGLRTETLVASGLDAGAEADKDDAMMTEIAQSSDGLRTEADVASELDADAESDGFDTMLMETEGVTRNVSCYNTVRFDKLPRGKMPNLVYATIVEGRNFDTLSEYCKNKCMVKFKIGQGRDNRHGYSVAKNFRQSSVVFNSACIFSMESHITFNIEVGYWGMFGKKWFPFAWVTAPEMTKKNIHKESNGTDLGGGFISKNFTLVDAKQDEICKNDRCAKLEVEIQLLSFEGLVTYALVNTKTNTSATVSSS